MGLKIIKETDPITVETLVMTLYAPPGIGKTSLAFSATDPLLLDTDQGAYRSAFRKDAAEAKSWEDIAGISASDVKPYKTLVLDTAGRALDLLAIDIMEKNPKHGRGGSLTLQGYGELKTRFANYLTLMRSFGLDIVLVAHSDEKQQGDEIVERIDMTGSSKQEVYKSSDAMARLGVKNGQRVLMFSPTDTQFGKDPANLGTLEIPNLADEPEFLGGVIQQIKDTLNELTAEQKEVAEKVAKRSKQWKGLIGAAESPEDFTGLVSKAKNKAEKKELLEAARKAGFDWSAGEEEFVAPEEEEADEPAEATA